MDVFVRFLVFIIKFIGWLAVAAGTGVYCLWSVLCQKIKDELNEMNKPKDQTTI